MFRMKLIVDLAEVMENLLMEEITLLGENKVDLQANPLIVEINLG